MILEKGGINVFIRRYRSIIAFVVTPSHLTALSRDEWGSERNVYEYFDSFVLFNNDFDREFHLKTVRQTPDQRTGFGKNIVYGLTEEPTMKPLLCVRIRYDFVRAVVNSIKTNSMSDNA